MSNALEVSGKNDGLVFRKKTDPAAWRSASPAKLIRGGCTIRCLVIADGTLEALKWLALVWMTGDHVNKYLFNGTLSWLFSAGRMTLPLFVFVLAYNLARPDTLERGVYPRTMKRLALFGVLATPAFIALGDLMAGWWSLNIMFALLGLTAMLYLIERRTVGGYVAAVTVFLPGGRFVRRILVGRPWPSAWLSGGTASSQAGNPWRLLSLPSRPCGSSTAICTCSQPCR